MILVVGSREPRWERTCLSSCSHLWGQECHRHGAVWLSLDDSPNTPTCYQASPCLFSLNVTPVSLPARWLEGYLQRSAVPAKPPNPGSSNLGTALGLGP